MMNTLEAALDYAEQGLHVFPCKGDTYPKDEVKTPLTRHGLKDASVDETQIRHWWARYPEAFIGIATGEKSGIAVLDVDVKNGKEGRATLETLLKDNGLNLPTTRKHSTRSGGDHYLFSCNGEPVKSTIGEQGLGEGLDVKGEGGYIIAPPSAGYDITVNLDLKNLPPFPAKLNELNGSAKKGNATTVNRDFAKIKKGGRHHAILSEAGRLHNRMTSPEDIFNCLVGWYHSNCEVDIEGSGNPITESWLWKLANHLDWQPDQAEAENNVSELIRAEDVEAEDITWVWKDRFALGFLHMIAGDAGLGKSLVMATIAACMSKGRKWPTGEGGYSGRTLIISAEDHIAKTIKPRLLAANADMRRIFFPSTQSNADFDLEKGIERLKRWILESGAKMVQIDPVTAFLGDVDSHKDADLRKVLRPLSDLAEELDVVIIGLAHMNKDSGKKALHRIGGSVAFGAAPRVVHLFCEDPSDENRKLMLIGKTNIGERVDGLAYRTKGVDVVNKNTGVVIETVAVAWESELVDITAEQAMSATPGEGKNALQEAKDFLEAELYKPLPSKDVQRRGKEQGISARTLARAKKELKIESTKIGMGGEWHWGFPERA